MGIRRRTSPFMAKRGHSVTGAMTREHESYEACATTLGPEPQDRVRIAAILTRRYTAF
jgi:hypothetical protein